MPTTTTTPPPSTTTGPGPVKAFFAAEMQPSEQDLLVNVDACLKQGVELMAWWIEADRTNSIPDRFELTTIFGRPDSGYSFFAEAPLSTGKVRVMGDVPRLFYDQPKGRELGHWCHEVEEFVLRYFMRIADTALPETVVNENQPTPPPPFDLVSMCPRGIQRREGFGFEQLYYKDKRSGQIGKIPEQDRYAIVDNRLLGTALDWVVASVRIFNFDLNFPVNPNLPRVAFPLREIQYVILAPEFVHVDHSPGPGLCARYTFGYAMLKPANDHSVLAYGPGQFDFGFQLFDFTVATDGTIRVGMPFVVNRPNRILNVSLDPLDWGFKAAELMTLGLARPLIEPLQDLADSLPFRPGSFDPVFLGIDALNLATGGLAAKQLCISKSQLEKIFLIFHFNQYYTMISGTLLTWRQVRNWADPAQVPEWVKTGRNT